MLDQMTLRLLLCLLVISLIIYITSLFVYRYLFHPLRNYPGAAWAKLTDGYGGYHALWRNLHITTWEDHCRYGSVVRSGPNKLVFNSAQAVRDIFYNEKISKSRVYLLTKSPPNVSNMFNVIDKKAHRAKRRVISQVLSERFMTDFEPQMHEQIDIFISKIQESYQNGVPANMTELCQRLTVDVVGLLGFGYPLNTQTDPANRFIFRGFMIASWRANVFMQFPILRNLKIDEAFRFLSFGTREKYIHLLEKMMGGRLAQDKMAHKDLYSVFPDQKGVDDIKLKDLWSEALFFLTAGGDTIATTLCALLFYLSRNERAYRALARELRTSFTTIDDIHNGPVLKQCHYLRACIDEALRLSPPAPSTLWREVNDEFESEEPIVIDGHVIPKGVQFGVNIYAMHHNEEYYPDSFAFKPERWLVSEQERSVLRSAFMPFSTGYRTCTGYGMAYLEASLVIAKLLWLFDFSAAPGELGEIGGGDASSAKRNKTGEFQLYHVFASTHDGPYLSFRPRDDSWLEEADL
ncbi:hypothetical protein E8E14_011958 [Neopestalotiopsis sp. 37M]|nr:hypothetical protein E8E14_011958 [Neopestalotiopsis sp. 37M]